MSVEIDNSQQSIADYMHGVGKAAREAARELGRSSTATRNQALTTIADAIEQARPDLVTANGRICAPVNPPGWRPRF